MRLTKGVEGGLTAGDATVMKAYGSGWQADPGQAISDLLGESNEDLEARCVRSSCSAGGCVGLPGIPVGSELATVNSVSKVTCYSLHWNGLRRKVVDLGAAPNVSNAACWSLK